MPTTTALRLPSASPAPAPLLVVGSVAFDDIETPFGQGRRILGGSASYASLAASYFAPVRLVGIVGHDFSAADRERFLRRGIDLTGLQTDLSGPTFFWAGRYHDNFNRRDTLATELNVFAQFRPELPPAWRQTPLVLLANIGTDLQHHVLDQVEGRPFVVADTMNLWINLMPDLLRRLLPRVHLLVLNEEEAAQFTGEPNPWLAGERLRAMGVPSVIVKMGSHGALLLHPEGRFALPAYPVTDVRDPTGAGDAFAGALAGYLAATGSTGLPALRQGMVYATAAASFTVEAFSCERLEAAGPDGLAARHAELLRLVAV